FASESFGHFCRPRARNCASALSGLTGSVSVTYCGVKVMLSTFTSGILATGCGNDVDGPGRRCARFAISGFVSNARQNRCAGVSEGRAATSKSLVQRLDFDGGRAVITAGPECNRCRGIVDKDATDVRLSRQKIFDCLAGLRIEPYHTVRRHAASP